MTETRVMAVMEKETLHEAAREFYDAVARAFPVCCVSDEFYYFPQVLPARRDWSAWDDFSAERVEEMAGRVKGWEEMAGKEEESADRSALLHALGTLREQLTAVGPHRRQPTWHLTVAGAGFMEALESDDPRAWPERVSAFPAYLAGALRCLDAVPALFLELGVKMVPDLLGWMKALRLEGRDTGDAERALEAFAADLAGRNGAPSFLLPPDLPGRIVNEHLGWAGSVDDGLAEIGEEIRAMEEILEEETARLAPGKSWVEAARLIPFEKAAGGDILGLYRREVSRLESICRDAGLLPRHVPPDGLLRVEAVPSCLAAVRASDSYGAAPGHPARGGTFYVLREGRGGEGRSIEYRMTSAHETWPGHHLLDCSRWSLENPLRRPLERPLFYEGWACLAEELAFRAGAWQGGWDRFVLARRRLKRAARGLVDLGLQTGRMTLDEAAFCLENASFASGEARSAVPKYALRPGYQVCYTLGLRKFLALFDSFDGESGAFVDAVLAQGEIGFDDLGAALQEVRTKKGDSPPFTSSQGGP
jgi:hypothetical protein